MHFHSNFLEDLKGIRMRNFKISEFIVSSAKIVVQKHPIQL